jgi:hypothetical protein
MLKNKGREWVAPPFGITINMRKKLLSIDKVGGLFRQNEKVLS